MTTYNKVVFGEQTIMDISNDTVTADKVLAGITAHDGSGAAITGTIQSVNATTITPTTSAQIAVPAGKYTNGAITVAAIQTEEKTVTENGVVTPSSGKYLSSVTVNVPTGSTINNQNKTVTPTTSQQSVTADSGYTGLGTITVDAIQTETKSITANGTYTPATGKYFSSVTVNVPSVNISQDANGYIVLDDESGYGGGGSGWTTDGIVTNAEPNGIITLGSSITTISAYALYGKPITQISGSGVTTIQTSALHGCQNLVSASFPNLTTIQGSGMEGARALTSFYAPNLTRAEGSALRYWTSYTGAIICPSLTYFGNCYGSAFSQIRFPSLTTLQGGDNFRNCDGAKVIDCGSVTSIPYESTFTGCAVLEVLILRRTNAITSLGRGSWGTGQKTLYNGTCKIYVPSALISTYISATNWSNLPNASTQFIALEGSPYEQPDFEYNE